MIQNKKVQQQKYCYDSYFNSRTGVCIFSAIPNFQYKQYLFINTKRGITGHQSICVCECISINIQSCLFYKFISCVYFIKIVTFFLLKNNK